MSLAHFESAYQLLTQRQVWEQKQRTYATMRHEGLRRRQKPFPTAADGHYPAIDMAIRKQKPFWLGQITAGNRLASFVSLAPQADTLAEAAADWFNFKVFQQSNFLQKMRVVVDTMLLRGRAVLKVTTNPFQDHALVFEAIDLLYLLVPDTANELADADEFVQVQQWTRPRYQAERRFDQAPETLAAICGAATSAELPPFLADKSLREGITHSSDANRIVIYEHWVRSPNGWTIYTYSPQAPDRPLRKPYGCAYKFNGKVSLPFFSFTAEVKDEGWYSPRGLGELLAPVEQYLTKLWNEKADAITFSNRPVLTADGEIPNVANLRWQPGEIIPQNVRGVQLATPPFSYDQEMMFARNIGEQQAMMPDFGITTTDGQGSRPRTATENERISALQSAGMNDNAMMFRDALTQVYRHVWGLLCQFKGSDFAYHAAGQIGQLPSSALHERYLIFPDGSPDGWNRAQRSQLAIQRLQAFAGNPNVSTEELTKEALYADDPRLALKAFIPSNQKANSEAEDEALEILVLAEGYPAAVMPGEDHATRILVDLGWLTKQGLAGAPVNPTARQRVQEHLAIHWQYLQQTDPEAAKKLGQRIAMQAS
ncbi:MAG TPA: hypothetical protein VF607_05600 [Verrucomicrobiae bacterium]